MPTLLVKLNSEKLFFPTGIPQGHDQCHRDGNRGSSHHHFWMDPTDYTNTRQNWQALLSFHCRKLDWKHPLHGQDQQTNSFITAHSCEMTRLITVVIIRILSWYKRLSAHTKHIFVSLHTLIYVVYKVILRTFCSGKKEEILRLP